MAGASPRQALTGRSMYGMPLCLSSTRATTPALPLRRSETTLARLILPTHPSARSHLACAQYECKELLDTWLSATLGIPIGCMLWRGLRVGNTSPRQAVIRQYTCG